MGTKKTPNSSVLKGGNNAQYVRMQKGHSLVLWIILTLLTAGIGIIWLIYYSSSPNHYWHF